ncbi:zona pellucida sperm-binding protein 4-like [Acanthochromis polyacanthus]|uniref:zona pellucida sperm-binding protein 4-like n=1 Tax=Acanthochromis polyacanthus TaxID=80966 RepID=UPI002233F8ED|nr:zona pellucida sperm-binding protein 4-like [Acanthochromis polyacanthus]
MAKFLGATSLVALALLGCLVGTEVEAQGSWMPSYTKPPSQTPQNSQDPQGYSLPPPGSLPNYQTPYVNPPPARKPPRYQEPNPPPPPPYPQSQKPKPPYHTHKKSPQLPSYDQAPQSPQIPKQQQPVTPPTKPQYPPPPRDCAVDLSVRITCGLPTITATECEALNCCFDGNNCYFGKAVTVGCTKDGFFVVVAAKDATQPNIDLEAISLLGDGQGCTHVDSNSQFAIYQFPVTACGSLVTEEPGVIVYENRLISAYEVGVGPRGAITRDSHYEVLFQCRYIGTSVETLTVDILPLGNLPLPAAGQGPISVQLRLANGQCTTKGCNEVDVAYNSFYTEADYPVRKVLRDPVYVEVQLLGKTDPLLVLTLGRCWATTSPEPHSLPQWDILIDG